MKVNVEVVEHRVYDIEDARFLEWVKYLRSGKEMKSEIIIPLIEEASECLEEITGVPVGDHYNDLEKYILGVYDEEHNAILEF